MVNLHYLELFYFLARHGGVSEAARKMPYGIRPSTIWSMTIILPGGKNNCQYTVWRVNGERLDERIEGQRDLVGLAGKAVIPPSEEKCYPAPESLRWREEHLVTTY